jgi:hypothetical protein
MITYRGDVSWIVIGEEEGRVAGDVPTRTFILEGRADQYETQRNSYTLGQIYQGGYIIRVAGRNTTSPIANIDVTVAFSPNFNTFSSPTTWSIETTTRSNKIAATSIAPEYAEFICRREVIYRSPTRQFTYFASSQPNGPRNTSNVGNPRHIRDIVTVDAFDSDGKLADRWQIPYNQLLSALRPGLNLQRESQAEVRATPIEGTPWWRCQDTVQVVYRNDPEES